ncbi:MAG: serine protease [Nitrosomonadaceae bacterium]|nr:serine protease [Nitrosomonadaceae bacterium]
MKALALLLILFQLLDASAQSLPETQRLYCTLSATYEVNPKLGRRYRKTIEELMTGTCWAANVNGQTVFFTAAHVLAHGPNFIPQPLERSELESLEIKSVIGLLGHEVQAVGIPKGNPDWVALRPKDARAFNGSQIKELSKVAPKVGEVMRVIGFPDTAHEQRTERTITSISPTGDFIVFSQRLDSGYSGGVVLNARGEAAGVVVTTGKDQSTALLLTAERLNGLEWKSFNEVKTRNFQ